MTKWIWPNHDNNEPLLLNLTEIETDKPYEANKPYFFVRGPPNFRVCFLVEERSEAGQVSQPVQACEPGLGDLSKLTAPAYFLGVKLMFVGVANFSQIKKIRFVIVNIFRSYSNQFLVILIRSSKFASNKTRAQKSIRICRNYSFCFNLPPC